jgi:histidinol phosphatase-like PHP family hydrolase
MALGNVRWGIQVARRAWVTPEVLLNSRPFEEMRGLLRRNRRVR